MRVCVTQTTINIHWKCSTTQNRNKTLNWQNTKVHLPGFHTSAKIDPFSRGNFCISTRHTINTTTAPYTAFTFSQSTPTPTFDSAKSSTQCPQQFFHDKFCTFENINLIKGLISSQALNYKSFFLIVVDQELFGAKDLPLTTLWTGLLAYGWWFNLHNILSSFLDVHFSVIIILNITI